jgi:hypothetical protein
LTKTLGQCSHRGYPKAAEDSRTPKRFGTSRQPTNHHDVRCLNTGLVPHGVFFSPFTHLPGTNAVVRASSYLDHQHRGNTGRTVRLCTKCAP